MSRSSSPISVSLRYGPYFVLQDYNFIFPCPTYPTSKVKLFHTLIVQQQQDNNTITISRDLVSHEVVNYFSTQLCFRLWCVYVDIWDTDKTGLCFKTNALQFRAVWHFDVLITFIAYHCRCFLLCESIINPYFLLFWQFIELCESLFFFEHVFGYGSTSFLLLAIRHRDRQTSNDTYHIEKNPHTIKLYIKYNKNK